MKKLTVVILMVCVSIIANAQKDNSKVNFNLGAELGLATGNLNIAYSIGIGATAQLEYAMDEKSRITVNSGIIQYIGKKISGTALKNQSNAVIPVLAGVKYDFASNFYGSAQLGVSLFTGKVGATKFTYVPGLGFRINEKLDALLKYTGYSDFGGAFGVRVAYSL
jgi:hypothetical protein